jgi:hypothetical protein
MRTFQDGKYLQIDWSEYAVNDVESEQQKKEKKRLERKRKIKTIFKDI